METDFVALTVSTKIFAVLAGDIVAVFGTAICRRSAFEASLCYTTKTKLGESANDAIAAPVQVNEASA